MSVIPLWESTLSKIENNVFNEEIQSGIHSLKQKLNSLRESDSQRRLQTRINWALRKWKQHKAQQQHNETVLNQQQHNRPTQFPYIHPNSQDLLPTSDFSDVHEPDPEETARQRAIATEQRIEEENNKARSAVYDETHPITHPYVGDMRAIITECLSALHHRTQQLEAHFLY